MALKITRSIAAVALLTLGGCSYINDLSDMLFPPDTSDNGNLIAPAPQQTAAGAQPGQRPVQEQPSRTVPAPAPVSSVPLASIAPGQPTGTFVGQKVASLRNDLQQLSGRVGGQSSQLAQIRTQIVQDSETYHGTVAAIEARLQVGTTPGNPILLQQWNEGQTELDRINADVLRLNQLSADVSSTSTMSAYLLDSVRASRTLSGGVDEDFRQLSLLEDDTNTVSVRIDRLLNDLASDTQRQQNYVASERSNLNLLAVAIRGGQMYSGSLSLSQVASSSSSGLIASAPGSTDRPLVVIRFDRPNVPYENALYTAVKGALDRRPSSSFEVVAATTPGNASRESATRRNAQSVVRSLMQMGLPADRVHLSTAANSSSSTGEVQVFIR